ncbi:hypothetical protein GBF38_013808 [Nibea albiflora]|uniref:Uncharacterized protein n=1 Tax=Nibea albiflora TaxID=240163 RepID=A0ACB7F6I8_NIBAL|nr:hypothetical protein GBF38_013808 [Nibea albiflora]
MRASPAKVIRKRRPERQELGMWSEGKSKRFGTMEDLCEEVEGEALDEEYDLGYTHIEDRDIDHGMTVSGPESENAEEMTWKVSEGHSDEETEERTDPVRPTNVDYDEELEIDRLVEQELENLATDSYSAHFAKQQSQERLHLQGKSVGEMTEQEETNTSPLCRNLVSSTDVTDQLSENMYFSDSSVPQTLTDEGIQHREVQEKRQEEDEHNVSMVTHADVTEDHSSFSDLTSKPDMEEINNSEQPNSVLEVTADQENLHDVAVPTEVKEVAPVEPSSASQEHLIEDPADCQEGPETAEWEVLKNPSEDLEIRDQNEDHEECDNVPAESYLHDDEGSDEGVMPCKDEPLEISPDSAPDENDIFAVKDSTERVDTNGTQDKNLHGFFNSGVKNDFWVSSLETGATYQPDDNKAAEQTNQNVGFDDNLVWGDLQNPNMVNWNSKVDIDSTKALAVKKEQEMHSEVKQVLCRNAVEGELVHSEESEVEGESWSSGEEPV